MYSQENVGARVLFISPGVGNDNNIGEALGVAGINVNTVYRAVHMPLPANDRNINPYSFVSWEGEEAPDWGGEKPDVIASCGIVKKFEIGDHPPISYDAEGLAQVSGAAYVDLAPGIFQTMKSVIIRKGLPLACEADVAVDRVQAAIATLNN